MLLVSRGYYPSRERAKAAVMEGCVYIGGRIYDKPGTPVDVDAELEVRGEACPFVGRGGFKLAKAVEVFGLDLNGAVGMDVGASTGGFTDCMLQNGAIRVYAVDVGHGQLDWKLRNDERVVCMEKTNIRYVTPSDIPDAIELASIDVSFISLSKVLPAVRELLSDGGDVAALIKPQFEAGREKVGKKGVVRDKAVHAEVIEACTRYANDSGFEVLGMTYSPIKGPEGNIEYLYHLRKVKDSPQSEAGTDVSDMSAIERLVDAAHEALDR